MAARKPRSKKKVAWHQNIDWRRWGWLAAKLALVGFAFLLVTGIYLDSLIREKFDGQKWQLPALVYSRPLELYPGQRLSLQQMLHELKLLNYRQSKQPQGAGAFTGGAALARSAPAATDPGSGGVLAGQLQRREKRDEGALPQTLLAG